VNLTGAIVNAIIFGDLAVLIDSLLRASSVNQAQIDTANIAMANIALKEEIREDVREYFQAVQLTQSQQQELDDFLLQISPSLKNQVNAAIFSSILNQENETIKDTIRKIIQSKGGQA
jgi:pantothenate kinase type III